VSMKKFIFLILFVLSNSVWGQKKLIEKFLSNKLDTTRKATVMPVPIFGYAQEIGFDFGVGGIYSFYTDKKDLNNRTSNFIGHASYSTKRTYNMGISGDLWTKRNEYHFITDIRFKKMPFNFYGIGNNTNEADEDGIVQKQFRILFDAEKAFVKDAYTGISAGFENYVYTDEGNGGIYSTSPKVFNRVGGAVLYLGVSQSYDTRNSNNYPTSGFFGRVTYQALPNIFTSSNFTGHQIRVNVRNFWSLSKKVVLGVQGFYHTLQGNNIPFYLYPQLGSDQMMRGYYTGRYRDENMITSQAELRYRFMNRFGVVAFAGTGKVFENNNFSLNNLKPNYGFGARYFFDPAKGLSLRVDYGFGEKKDNEKRQKGMYIGLAEAF